MKIGFIGLGHMGSHMAHNLAQAGNEVAVYDVRTEAATALVERTAGMRLARSIADAAHDADYVGTSLPGPAEVEAVVLGPGGLCDSMKSGSTYIDLSTNSVTTIRKLAAVLAEKGISMLDAPVSGGERGSKAGTLSVMVGGSETVYDQAQPFLAALGSKIFHCGEIGNGTVVKLCNNLAALGAGAFLGEVLTLGVKSGVDLKTLTSVIGVSSGKSPRLTGGFLNRTFRRQFEGFGFTVALSAKDARLAVELAHDMGVPVDMGEIVARDLAEAVDMGVGALDFDAMVQVQEKRSGVTLLLSDEEIEEVKRAVEP